MITLTQKDLSDFSKGTQKEWILANGLGGYSSSSVLGCHTRRYHGLLVAALQPPHQRTVVVSKLDEEIEFNGQVTALSTNQYPGTVSPQGYIYLENFALAPLPTWTISTGAVRLQKTVFMIREQNTVVCQYRVLDCAGPFQLRLIPFLVWRGLYEPATKAQDGFFQGIEWKGRRIVVRKGKREKVALVSDRADFVPKEPCWYYNLEYSLQRNADGCEREDCWNPGYFQVTLRKGDILHIAASTEEEIPEVFAGLKETEELRLKKFEMTSPLTEGFCKDLVRAADSFLVRNPRTQVSTIVAGYHWFGPWGRDVLVSLPGLTLTTGRVEKAKEILLQFSKALSNGFFPRYWTEEGRAADSLAADVSLWFFDAVHKYFQTSQDKAFIQRSMLGVLEAIFEGYVKGSPDGCIRMDEDGLVWASHPTQPLTWMDARVNGRAVTPRSGKPVEVSALWYQALKILELFSDRYRALARELAERVRESFEAKFWNEEKRCLYDCIGEEGADASIRPNQIFAVSLDFAVLEGEKARCVVECVQKELLNAFGLYSLSPKDLQYKGQCAGTQSERDEAYHQGTIWSWLIGPFLTAYCKVNSFSEESRRFARHRLEAFERHLNDAGLGTISEIFDGEYPHAPRGCISQAWSVAEIMRVLGFLQRAGTPSRSVKVLAR